VICGDSVVIPSHKKYQTITLPQQKSDWICENFRVPKNKGDMFSFEGMESQIPCLCEVLHGFTSGWSSHGQLAETYLQLMTCMIFS
jgi:hypothetical protein